MEGIDVLEDWGLGIKNRGWGIRIRCLALGNSEWLGLGAGI
jgi:hypothetical protein